MHHHVRAEIAFVEGECSPKNEKVEVYTTKKLRKKLRKQLAPVPASLLRLTSRELWAMAGALMGMNSREDYEYNKEADENSEWQHACELWGIPFTYIPGSELSAQDCAQLTGQKYGAGMKIRYNNRNYVVIDCELVDAQAVGEPVGESPQLECVCIARARYIDLSR